jgi:tetraacyldisaccharide 4'-kinase
MYVHHCMHLSSFPSFSFHELVSGRRKGLAASFLRAGLRLAEIPYTWAVRRRNLRYDRGRAAIHRVAVPVVSVGNLTLGGTGKTPLVRWIVQWFLDRGVSAAIVSRGYGARRAVENDEALELRAELPGVGHVQNPDRVAAAREAIERFGCRAIVLDDAFQHRRLARDLDLVLLDASEPLGFQHVFPRGTLREPVDGLRRADMVLLSRADLIDAAQRNWLRGQVARYAPQAAWGELVHAPLGFVSREGLQQPIASLAGRRIAAFAGIGNPAGFRHTLESCGCRPAAFWEFPDHHAYTPADLASLAARAKELDAAAVVCTRKDLVKIDAERLGDVPLWALKIGLDFLSGQELLEERLSALLSPSPSGKEPG